MPIVNIKIYIAVDQPDIILVSETWFNENSCPSLDGFNIYRRDINDRRCGGGVKVFMLKTHFYLLKY